MIPVQRKRLKKLPVVFILIAIYFSTFSKTKKGDQTELL